MTKQFQSWVYVLIADKFSHRSKKEICIRIFITACWGRNLGVHPGGGDRSSVVHAHPMKHYAAVRGDRPGVDATRWIIFKSKS